MPARLVCPLMLLIFSAGAGAQAPVVGPFGVLHGASYQPMRLLFEGLVSTPGIAPGAIFILKGAYLGPEELVVSEAPFGLRLPDEIGGTEVHVRSIASGEVMQARIIHAWSFQVAAILPESFPLGEAELEVRYQGQAGAPQKFQVVGAYPGLFTLSASGYGRGVVQNFESPSLAPLNGLTRPAHPGQYLILWATGLGDAAPEEVEVRVGGRVIPVAYAGPAPGLDGVDQINVRLPDDLESRGCYVNLGVFARGVSSGQAFIAVSPSGGPCEHPWGLSPERLAEIEAGARASYIRLDLSNGASSVEGPQPPFSGGGSAAMGQSLSFNEDALGSYAQGSGFAAYLIPAARLSCTGGNRVGSIIFGDFSEPIPSPPEPPDPPVRAAGSGEPWRFSGPGGKTFEMESNTWPAAGYLGPATFEEGFLEPGEWRVQIPAGTELGPLETAVRMPALPEVEGPDTIRPNEAFDVTWQPQPVEPGLRAVVSVSFWIDVPGQPGARRTIGLACPAALSLGKVTVTLGDLQNPLEGVEAGEITFRLISEAALTDYPGVDRVEAVATAYRSWSVPVE